MRFNKLSDAERELIKSYYNDSTKTKETAQKELSKLFKVTSRTIRDWAKNMNLVNQEHKVNAKIMIYDIETSRVTAKLWWSGKQFINSSQIIEDPTIISIAWKWLGEDEVYTLNWDMKKHCDKDMLKTFLKEYNKADMIIGQNNDRFDNRWINARAVKHSLFVDTNIKSFDIMKQTKRLLRLPGYSMAYISKYLGVTQKQSHEGILMWDMVESGTVIEQKEYMRKMLDYNIGDIITTEEIYLKLRPYMGLKIHVGVIKGEEKWTSPNTGTTDVELYKTSVTPVGTIQRFMRCRETETIYKISNREYMKFLDYNTEID